MRRFSFDPFVGAQDLDVGQGSRDGLPILHLMDDILKRLVDVLYIMHKASGKATRSVLREFNLKDPNKAVYAWHA